MPDNKDLSEVVAEILIELQQTRENTATYREEQTRRWEEQTRQWKEQQEVNALQTKELHFQRERQERMQTQLDSVIGELRGVNEKLTTNQEQTNRLFERMMNAVLDWMDVFKDKNKTQDVHNDDVLRRIDALEKTVYGKAS